MTVREWIADTFFGEVIAERTEKATSKAVVGLASEVRNLEQQLASVKVRVDDSAGWTSLNTKPGDRPWAERLRDLMDALEAWRRNFFVRRIVNLTHGYVVGNGITISSENADVQAFIDVFWKHRKNKISRRLVPLCDQLTRDGELFPILFTNPQDGMSYLRFRTAAQISEIETLKNDWEEERVFIEPGIGADRKRWYGKDNPRVQRKLKSGKVHPVMLHWTINKPLDALRGEGDLGPVLPWAKRYSEWLKDRVRLNRQRTRQGMMDVTVQDDAQVEKRRNALQTSNPLDAGIYVHGTGEEVAYPDLSIDADNAEGDGKVLRLAIATGSNLAMHYLGEGEAVNYASAKEMGEPTARFYTERQLDLIWMLCDLIETAYARYCLIKGKETPDDLQLKANVTEVARADNEALANAARSIATAFALAGKQGWIDDETALTLILKFAGEALSKDEIKDILKRAKDQGKGDDEAGSRE